jgi:hypothetical protein
LGFQDHGDDFAGAHEVGEFAEKRASSVDGVEAAGFFFGQAHGFDRDYAKARFVDAGEDVALLTGLNRVGLDDCKCAFECHERILRDIECKMPG